MAFLNFLLLAAIAYLIWRITDQLPDLIFRISEIQRDVAELRRTLSDAPSRPISTVPPPSPRRTENEASDIVS
jgi:hypothetical protein